MLYRDRRHGGLRHERWLRDWELAELRARTAKASHDARWRWRREVRVLRGETARLLARARALVSPRWPS
jgi:hypothetical protein